MLADLRCDGCGSEEVMSITPGTDAEYWPGRSFEGQDIGVAPILLCAATRDICYCWPCWLAKFRANAVQRQTEET